MLVLSLTHLLAHALGLLANDVVELVLGAGQVLREEPPLLRPRLAARDGNAVQLALRISSTVDGVSLNIICMTCMLTTGAGNITSHGLREIG